MNSAAASVWHVKAPPSRLHGRGSQLASLDGGASTGVRQGARVGAPPTWTVHAAQVVRRIPRRIGSLARIHVGQLRSARAQPTGASMRPYGGYALVTLAHLLILK